MISPRGFSFDVHPDLAFQDGLPMKEKRINIRTNVGLKILLSHPVTGAVTAVTRDISNSGVFIVTPESDKLPVGSIVTVQTQDGPEDAPILRMRVVRHENDGIGLEFIDDGGIE